MNEVPAPTAPEVPQPPQGDPVVSEPQAPPPEGGVQGSEPSDGVANPGMPAGGDPAPANVEELAAIPTQDPTLAEESELFLDIGTQNYTAVKIVDEPEGGVNHVYQVIRSDLIGTDKVNPVLAGVHFQKGPVKESGINGCHHEDLLAIVMHRLTCFQEGPYACPENGQALALIEQAMATLNARTAAREERGVEGTSTV